MTAAILLLLAAAEYSAPAGIRTAIRRPGAASILPGGRIVAPIGIQYVTGPGTFALAISPSGKTIVSANRGPERFSLTTLEREKGERRIVRHIMSNGESEDWRGVSTGAAFDGERMVYVSEGASGRVWAANPADGSRKRALDLNQGGVSGSVTGDLAFDTERKLLYVLDSGNARLAAVDVNRRRITASAPLGKPPRALALAPDRRRAYVVMEDGLAVVNLDKLGLGDTVRTGKNLSGVAATADRIFVSDSADDVVTVIDAKSNQVIASVPMRISGLEDLRGLAPAGLAFHEHTGWLLVAEQGANAVGVIDTKEMKLIGHVPVGWSPARILIEGDTVYVTNTKGQGVGPNLGRPMVQDGFITPLRRGSVTAFPLPAPGDLPNLTSRVMAANGYAPKAIAAVPIPEAIERVILIVKGNRTFDDVLGDVREAGKRPVMGAPALARYGRLGYADGRNVRLSLQRVDVTPNHHSLAATFSFSDNFYADGALPWAQLERLGTTFRGAAGASDQSRADQFIQAMRAQKEPWPRLVILHLPDDTAAAAPSESYPYDASYVAGNDYALGRIVEFLSNTPWWRSMAVFITQEDTQSGLDHIDAHRTVLLCAGPYFKPGYVSHVNASFPGLLKTMLRILRLPPLGLADATASNLADTFTNTPDFTPYAALPVDKRLFDPAKVTEPILLR